ncbi:hemagglutinin repeat-containing protein [Paraneptunicella aestuarii]|uniref:hemagglutinin repeat-containing protein n=1 Tax=Paraneptunicella aestuarii TaxID=2831148 RepID=UPI001E3C3CAC|nr:hemagglutinin repeat-containing protein [Paraneptunicella aestuarii]UAA37607.1 hemagglutinin repeat-containing protein [Paraneptunicella aestuarii]
MPISQFSITITTGYEDENTFGQTGNTLIQGSTLVADGDMTIATGNLDVLASRDTFEQTITTQDASFSVQQTVYGSAGGPSFNASYGQSESDSEDKSTTYNNSVLSVNNINIVTAENASFVGANVDATNHLDLTVGATYCLNRYKTVVVAATILLVLAAGVAWRRSELW